MTVPLLAVKVATAVSVSRLAPVSSVRPAGVRIRTTRLVRGVAKEMIALARIVGLLVRLVAGAGVSQSTAAALRADS